MPLRLLVVEDSKTMQRVLQIALSQQDASLVMASDPAQALAAVAHQVFDLLVVDVDLAGQDAYALCRQLREACAGDVPAVLITSAQHSFDPGRATHVGIKGHIDKPFATQALVAVVMAAAGRAPPAQASEAAHEAPHEPQTQHHIAAIDAALAALSAEQGGARAAGTAGVPEPSGRPPAFIRLEGGDAAAPTRSRPKPFFEEETTSSRAFGTAAGPVTVVRRPSDALREQSRAEAKGPSVDALPALPPLDAPLASPAALTAGEPPGKTPLEPAPDGAAAASESHSPAALAAQRTVGPLPGAAGPSMAQELVDLLQRGPQSASTPALNAALTAALEQQLSQILWQILPGIVTEEVRRVLAQAPPYVPAEVRPSPARAP